MKIKNTSFSRPLPLFLTFIPSVIDDFSDAELIEVMRDADSGRLNLSHVAHEQHRQRSIDMIERLHRLCPHLKFGIDLQGFETRLAGGGSDVIHVRPGDKIILSHDPSGTKINSGKQIYTKQPFIFDFLDKYGMPAVGEGQRISIDDVSTIFRFADYDSSSRSITLETLLGGQVHPLKSVATTLPLEMPEFADNRKDNEDIAWTLEMIKNLAIPHDQIMYCYSFTQNARNILDLREALGNDEMDIWAKIEDRQGVMHLDEISEVSNALVIARGDGMATMHANPARSVVELGDAIWENCARTGRLPIVATANWESSGRDGRPNPMEMEYATIIGRRNPDTVFWSSNVCMKKEYLLPAVRAHCWVREAI